MKRKKKLFPIMIVDEKDSRITRWIALTKDIDFKNKRYNNIIGFHRNCITELNSEWVYRLLYSNHEASFAEEDIIRHPTMEEYLLLTQILKSSGYQINLRTHEIVKINE